MKNVIKLFIILFAVSFAFDGYAQVTFGLKAGAGLSKFRVLDDDEKYTDDISLKPTFHAGFVLDFGISDLFSIESGLQYSGKGALEKFTSLGNDYKYYAHLGYVDLPVLFKVGHKFGNNKVYAAMGPYLGVGIHGKGVVGDESEPIEWGNDDDEFNTKRLDGGVEMRFGVELGMAQLSLFHQVGLADIAAYSYNGYRAHNRGFGMSVAVLFNKDNQ